MGFTLGGFTIVPEMSSLSISIFVSTEPFANDSNADILGIAVVNISSFAGSWWQYAECSDPMSLSCTVSPSSWIDFPRNISEDRAILISANARIRPSLTEATHGAVWFEAHAYDGSTDGLQNFAGNGSIDSTGMVVGVDGVGGVTAFSSGTVYIFSVVQPAIEYPSFNDGADLPLVNLPEDTLPDINNGTSIVSLLSRSILTRLHTVDNTTIVNLPVDEARLSMFDSFSDYYTQVALVNSLVSDRNSASQNDSQPGLIVEFQLPDTAGRWQISPRGTLQAWYYVDRLLSGTSSNNTVLLLCNVIFIQVFIGNISPMTGLHIHIYSGPCVCVCVFR